MIWDPFWPALPVTARSRSSASRVRRLSQTSAAMCDAYYPDDGSTDASIFPAHGTGANAVSWAPSVVSTPNNAGPRSPAQGQIATQKRFVTGGSDNLIRIWAYDDEQKKWAEEEVIKEHEDWVRDVAWAPNIGLPGMYIASASQVSHVFSSCLTGCWY